MSFTTEAAMLALLCCLLCPLFCVELTAWLQERFEHENLPLIHKQMSGLLDHLNLC